MNKPLTDVLPELKERLQTSYADFLAKAASHEREKVEGILQQAHEGAVHLLNRSHPRPHSHEFAHAWSLLNDDVPMLAETASYFALENAHWIIVGLDSAYGASEFEGYLHGQLNASQLTFLNRIAAKASATGKKIVVLSHHPGLALTGEPCLPLWSQVTQALGGSLAYWYWGHVHAAVAYKMQDGVLLELQKNVLTESFIDENNRVRCSASYA